MALAEPRFVGAEDERHVGKYRQSRAQRLIQQHLLGSIRNVVGAADDVRDAEVNVVGDHAQVVRRAAVVAQEDEIFDLGIRELDFAEDGVVESGTAGFWNGKAYCGRFSCILSPQSLGAVYLPTNAFVAGRPFFRSCFGSRAFDFLFGAEAVVCCARLDQPCGGGAVQIDSLGLVVGAFVPREAEPLHPLKDAFDHFWRGAFEVGVFDPQDQSSPKMPGEKPVKQGGSGPSDVQIPGRRRSEPDTRFGVRTAVFGTNLGTWIWG